MFTTKNRNQDDTNTLLLRYKRRYLLLKKLSGKLSFIPIYTAVVITLCESLGILGRRLYLSLAAICFFSALLTTIVYALASINQMLLLNAQPQLSIAEKLAIKVSLENRQKIRANSYRWERMKYCEFEWCEYQHESEHNHCALCNSPMRIPPAGEPEAEFKRVFGREVTEEEKKNPCCQDCFEKAKRITFPTKEHIN